MQPNSDLRYNRDMPTPLTVAEFPYPQNTHAEVLAQDSIHLLGAMKRKYPNCNFITFTSGGKKLTLQVVGSNDFQRISMTYFAEGFMASAHLWER